MMLQIFSPISSFSTLSVTCDVLVKQHSLFIPLEKMIRSAILSKKVASVSNLSYINVISESPVHYIQCYTVITPLMLHY